MKRVSLLLFTSLRMTRWQGAAGAFILLLHAALFAFGPPSAIFLANHEHVVVGVVTADQWRAHVEAHLRQAGSHYLSLGASHAPLQADQPRITSLPGCGYDALSVSVRALAGLLLVIPHSCALLIWVGLIDVLSVLDRSPDLALRPPPPKLLCSDPSVRRGFV